MALETTLLEIILTPMDEESRLYMEETYPGEDHHTVFSRPQIYENTAGYSLREIADKLAAITHHYLDAVWPKGYGGLNWFRSTVHTLRYYDAITSGDVSTIIDATNVLLNCQHNGGWLFNKFVQQTVMDSASGSPLLALAASAPYLYEFLMPKTGITRPDDASSRTDSRVAPKIAFVQHSRTSSGQTEHVSFRVNDTFNSLWMPWTPDNQALMQEYLAHA